MTTFLLIFTGSALYVALRAFQQRNVVQDRFLSVWPVSMLMATADVFIITSIVEHSVRAILPLGLGGAVGCTIAMLLHGRIYPKP